MVPKTALFPTFFRISSFVFSRTKTFIFGTICGWVNDDRIFIFGWTIPLIHYILSISSAKMELQMTSLNVTQKRTIMKGRWLNKCIPIWMLKGLADAVLSSLYDFMIKEGRWVSTALNRFGAILHWERKRRALHFLLLTLESSLAINNTKNCACLCVFSVSDKVNPLV